MRSLEHFSIGDDLIPREMIPAYAIVKKAAALVNHKAGRLGNTRRMPGTPMRMRTSLSILHPMAGVFD